MLQTTPPNTAHRLLAAAILAAASFITSVLLIVWGRVPSRVAYDQMWFHEPAIRRFMAEWPTPDLSNYLSATTPGYHLLMTAAGLATGGAVWVMQLVSALIGAALVGLVGWEAGRAGLRGAFFALPVLASAYVVSSSAWLLPDNAGWLGVLLVLLMSMRAAARPGWWRWGAAAALVLTLLVFTRQLHLWAAAMIWAGAWVALIPASQEAGWKGVALTAPGVRFTRAVVAGFMTAPAFAIVGGFFLLWEGLTPPAFHGQYGGSNPAGAAFVLSVFGVYSVFFLPTILPALVALWRDHRGWLIAALAAGFLLAVLPRTDFDYEAGRRTGLWNLAAKFPEIAGRTSTLIVPLAVWGAAAVAAWLALLGARERMVVLAGLAGFAAAVSASPEVWQRYVDPLALILMAMIAGRAGEQSRPWLARGLLKRLAPVGPVVLAGLLALVTVRGLMDSRPLDGPPPPLETGDRAGRMDSPVVRYYQSIGEPVPGPISDRAAPEPDQPGSARLASRRRRVDSERPRLTGRIHPAATAAF